MGDTSTLEIQLEFGGGMELLFSSIPSRKLTLPRTYDSTILSTTTTTTTTTTTESPPPPPLTMITSTTTTTTTTTCSTKPEMNSNRFIEIEQSGSQLVKRRRTDLRYLIWFLRWNVLDDSNRPELFTIGQTVPGILVLINSTDWELEGELDYLIEDGDQIVFISTLHGG